MHTHVSVCAHACKRVCLLCVCDFMIHGTLQHTRPSAPHSDTKVKCAGDGHQILNMGEREGKMREDRTAPTECSKS